MMHSANFKMPPANNVLEARSQCNGCSCAAVEIDADAVRLPTRPQRHQP